ncbi:MAG: NifB/NifX family molybdenum-iron cluster-binding protein [Verrucomicrobiae bacterium]|nr:NifB/NifX family molybdenum-iron cluster-binding protein [Verrucomicrobiae bacterium]
MKIAISASGADLNSQVDPRFGRAARFILFDTEKQTFSVVDNTKNLNAAQGAGIQSAENVSRSGAKVVITGHCGPKAFRALQAANVQVVVGASGAVSDAIEQFRSGKLKTAESADVEGHWS